MTPADLSAAQELAFCNPRRLHWLHHTELCCTLSHLAALRRLVQDGAPHAAVFEDDVVLSPALPAFLAEAERTPSLPHLVRLETDNKGVRLSPRGEGHIGAFALRRAFSPTSGAAGYLVSRAGAQAILDSRRVMQVPIDHALFNPYERLARALSMRHLVPALCAQWDRIGDANPELSRSDLEGGRALKSEAAHRYPMSWWLQSTAAFLDRELLVGPQQLFNRLRRGTSKRIVPFRAD